MAQRKTKKRKMGAKSSAPRRAVTKGAYTQGTKRIRRWKLNGTKRTTKRPARRMGSTTMKSKIAQTGMDIVKGIGGGYVGSVAEAVLPVDNGVVRNGIVTLAGAIIAHKVDKAAGIGMAVVGGIGVLVEATKGKADPAAAASRLGLGAGRRRRRRIGAPTDDEIKAAIRKAAARDGLGGNILSETLTGKGPLTEATIDLI